MGGYILKTVSGTHIGVYILPRALYTNMTHRLIYLETMCNIEEKEWVKQLWQKQCMTNLSQDKKSYWLSQKHKQFTGHQNQPVSGAESRQVEMHEAP